MRQRIYLDHAATTPVLPEAQTAILHGLEQWANPSSPHSEGRAARAVLERAREDIKEALGWRHDVIFTSGASEAVEIAASRARVSGRALNATEHPIVPHAFGSDAMVLPVDSSGIVSLDALDEVLAQGPGLIAIQQVNNETGVLQPMEEIADRVRAAGSLLLSDCAQSAGKTPLPDADFIALSAHKLGGPPGIGALLVKDLATIEPTGGQEKGYRRGTQDAPAAAGFAAALVSGAFEKAMPRLSELRRRLEDGVTAAAGMIIGAESPRLPHIGCVAMPGTDRASLLVQFDLAGIAVSAGSACGSGKMQESPVLKAMNVDPAVAASVLRISFGPSTSEDEVDAFLAEWHRIAERQASRAA